MFESGGEMVVVEGGCQVVVFESGGEMVVVEGDCQVVVFEGGGGNGCDEKSNAKRFRRG